MCEYEHKRRRYFAKFMSVDSHIFALLTCGMNVFDGVNEDESKGSEIKIEKKGKSIVRIKIAVTPSSLGAVFTSTTTIKKQN